MDSWVEKIPWRRDRLPTPVFLGFPCGSAGKESFCNVRVLGSIPGLGRYPGERKGYHPLQYSGLKNSMDCTVCGVAKNQAQLGDFHFLLLGRKAMTNLDNILKIRDITLLKKVCRVNAMAFPVIMYRYIKEAEH